MARGVMRGFPGIVEGVARQTKGGGRESSEEGEVGCRELLGGLLRSYDRDVA